MSPSISSLTIFTLNQERREGFSERTGDRVRICPKSSTSDRRLQKKKKKKKKEWRRRVGDEKRRERASDQSETLTSIREIAAPAGFNLPVTKKRDVKGVHRTFRRAALTKPVNTNVRSRSMAMETIVSPFSIRIASDCPARESIIYPFVGARTSRPINCRPLRNGNFHAICGGRSADSRPPSFRSELDYFRRISNVNS